MLAMALTLIAAFFGVGCASAPPPETTAPSTSASTGTTTKTLVGRVWHGRTPASKAEEYTRYLNDSGVKKIFAIEGNRGAQLFRRIDGDVAEYFVISYWDTREAIKKFAGEDIEKTHNLPRDPEFLIDLEPRVRHFDVLFDSGQKGEPRVGRVWHGRTPASKAEEYTRYSKEAGLAKMVAIDGNRGVQLFRRTDGDVAEYFVISYWDAREAIKEFAGDDIEKTHNLPRDPEFLIDLEPHVRHFDLIANQWHEPRSN